MRLLLDTHVFVWVKSAPNQLGHAVIAAIVDPDNEVYVSSASAWELWLKHAKKPIVGLGPALSSGAAGFRGALEESSIDLLDIRLDHVAKATALPSLHHDPFDRMLIGQALVEQLTIVSKDRVFAEYKGLQLLKV